MRINHMLVTTALKYRVVLAEIDRKAERKTSTVGSRTTDHRHRQPRPSVRRWLGLGELANCGTPAEAVMRHRGGQDSNASNGSASPTERHRARGWLSENSLCRFSFA